MAIKKDITLGEIATCFIAVIAIITTALFARITIQRNDKNIDNTSRAFIFIDKENMAVKPASDGGIFIYLPWKNFGSTPAINILDSENTAILKPESSNINLLDFDFPDQIKIDDKTPRNVLAPGTTLPLRHNHLTLKDLNEDFKEKRKLYTWAWIEYNDIVSTVRHRTEFCVEMTIESISPEIIINETMCNRFNGFDNSTTFPIKTQAN